MTRSELIAALEKATEPSRKLDLDIYLASNGLTQYEQVVWHGANPVIRYYPGPPGAEYRGIPRYTTSLDAALTLVPRGWASVVYIETDGSGDVRIGKYTGDESFMDVGITPAVAVCIAALHAMEATDDA